MGHEKPNNSNRPKNLQSCATVHFRKNLHTWWRRPTCHEVKKVSPEDLQNFHDLVLNF